jgi:hypothetical protein
MALAVQDLRRRVRRQERTIEKLQQKLTQLA